LNKPHHKKYYTRPNTSAKCKELTHVDMMEIYEKKHKKASSEPDSQFGSTNQAHDLGNEIEMIP